ncbi:MAG: UvrD-helicase domain-containing protein [Actinomycetota bacterium]
MADHRPEDTADQRMPVDQAHRDRIRGVRDVNQFVEAGAGSGKTRALVDRVEALVLDDAIPLEAIAAITFTEKAAAELRDRIRQRFESAARGGDERRAAMARGALLQLDGAAIGTLHSFAQRILGEHPVEAGLPPGVDVLDEIGSQVEFEQRWRLFLDALLDDESMATTLLYLEAAGIRLDALRALALQMAANWDLVEERLRFDTPPPPAFDRTSLLRQIDAVYEMRQYADPDADDSLLRRFPDLWENREALTAAVDDVDAMATAAAMSSSGRPPRAIKVGRSGNKDNWRIPVTEVRDAFKDLLTACDDAVARVTTGALAHMASRLGRFVLETAEERREVGRLEFHDLLVRARRLLRHPAHGAEVRASLGSRYPRLLLDEFQDTDPIQIELAVLIAASTDDVQGKAWHEIPTRPGSLFLVGDPKQSIYRFRRADIATFLTARHHITDRPALTVNFRTTEPIIAWINHVFAALIQAEPGSQPEYVALSAHREEAAPVGPAVAVLGAEPLAGELNAEQLRGVESREVAAAISELLYGDEPWAVADDDGRWRTVRANDVCVLLPARTSLASLEAELDAAGVPYRAETSSLVYASREVREVLLALTAVADPTDELATVTALRSFVYGCGDDDLAHWRLGVGGRFSIRATVPEGTDEHPVADGLRHLQTLHEARLWSTPAELLDRIIRERGVLETAIATGAPRDVWRRLRFVIDQARAWVDAGGVDLRAYLQWARLQGADNARVSETVLPETDDDSVRIMTIHGSKGLEFPVTVLAGMTTRISRPARGPSIAFPPTGDPVLRLSSEVTSEGYDAWKPIDDQMDEHERLRLLYVAATRARDHLVVCLHRTQSKARTGASVVADPALTTNASVSFEPVRGPRRTPSTPEPAPIPDRQEWLDNRTAALAAASARTVVAATTLAREAAEQDDPGLEKRPRDLDLPPWQKGRYGTAVGRAVHGVLQLVDLATGAGLADAAAAQAAAEGVANRQAVVEQLARHALDASVTREAAAGDVWRELWVAAPIGEHLVEGYVDLLYRTLGGLVVVDWKTDHVDDDAAVAAKVARYRLQGAAYAAAVEAATGEPVHRMVFVFLGHDGAIEADLPDLRAAIDEVRTSTGALAAASATAFDID